VLAVAIVSLGALCIGAPPLAIAESFGSGFWSIIPFTMQMAFIIIGGYVIADSPPIATLMARLAAIPRTGRGAVALVALFSATMSLIHWGFSMVASALLVRAIARRGDLPLDYRAAGAAACTGFGSVWALGLSSSAALLQANAASMPPGLLAETGVIPFSQTIFLWQSMLCAVILIVASTWIAWNTAPSAPAAHTAHALGIDLQDRRDRSVRGRPGEWLEYSPVAALFIAALGAVFLAHEFAVKGFAAAISNLNTYNLLFIVAALVLQWRPRRFVDAVARSVPGTAGVLIQFPFLGAIAAILTGAKNGAGQTLSAILGSAFTHIASHATFAPIIGAYSALLGLRGGGAAQSHQSLLDAADPGDSRTQGPRSDRLHRGAVRDQSAAGSFALVGAGCDAALSSAARAPLIDRANAPRNRATDRARRPIAARPARDNGARRRAAPD
jgi:short-chain fatty acids transporter